MKHLRQYIRQILINEALKFGEDIMILTNLQSLGISYLLVKRPPAGYRVTDRGQFYKDFVLAGAYLRHMKPDKCYGARMVSFAAAHSGWGPTFYDLLMELEPKGLINDRESVSPAMLRMMRKYKKDRPDVERKLLDNVKDKITYPRTPQPEDDCTPGDGRRYHGGVRKNKKNKRNNRWEDDPLSYVYSKQLTARTQEIAKAGETFMAFQGSALTKKDVSELAFNKFNDLLSF